jgi:hypothetical protein
MINPRSWTGRNGRSEGGSSTHRESLAVPARRLDGSDENSMRRSPIRSRMRSTVRKPCRHVIRAANEKNSRRFFPCDGRKSFDERKS